MSSSSSPGSQSPLLQHHTVIDILFAKMLTSGVQANLSSFRTSLFRSNHFVIRIQGSPVFPESCRQLSVYPSGVVPNFLSRVYVSYSQPLFLCCIPPSEDKGSNGYICREEIMGRKTLTKQSSVSVHLQLGGRNNPIPSFSLL